MGLFGFGKKKETPAEKKPRASVNVEELLDQAEGIRTRLADASGEGRASLLNDLGRILADAGDVDAAIAAYEESLEIKRTMGKASAALVKLYNKKRAEAAAAKDSDAIAHYMEKVNELLALSKDQLRGRA